MTGKKRDLEEALKAADKMEPEFLKEQLLASKRFEDRRDIIDALLEDGKLYSLTAVEEKIKDYRKGKVK